MGARARMQSGRALGSREAATWRRPARQPHSYLPLTTALYESADDAHPTRPLKSAATAARVLDAPPLAGAARGRDTDAAQDVAGARDVMWLSVSSSVAAPRMRVLQDAGARPQAPGGMRAERQAEAARRASAADTLPACRRTPWRLRATCPSSTPRADAAHSPPPLAVTMSGQDLARLEARGQRRSLLVSAAKAVAGLAGVAALAAAGVVTVRMVGGGTQRSG